VTSTEGCLRRTAELAFTQDRLAVPVTTRGRRPSVAVVGADIVPHPATGKPVAGPVGE
jgi:hypothetical protein